MITPLTASRIHALSVVRAINTGDATADVIARAIGTLHDYAHRMAETPLPGVQPADVAVRALKELAAGVYNTILPRYLAVPHLVATGDSGVSDAIDLLAKLSEQIAGAPADTSLHDAFRALAAQLRAQAGHIEAAAFELAAGLLAFREGYAHTSQLLGEASRAVSQRAGNHAHDLLTAQGALHGLEAAPCPDQQRIAEGRKAVAAVRRQLDADGDQLRQLDDLSHWSSDAAAAAVYLATLWGQVATDANRYTMLLATLEQAPQSATAAMFRDVGQRWSAMQALFSTAAAPPQ